MKNKVIDFIKKYKLLVLLAVVSLPLIVIFLWRFPQETPLTPPPAYYPSDETIRVIRTVPPRPEFLAGNTRGSIFVYTNKELDPITIIATSSPSLKFDLRVRYDDPLRLILTPRAPWQTGQTYQITIRKGAVSKDRQSYLDQDVVMTLEIKPAPEFGGGDAE